MNEYEARKEKIESAREALNSVIAVAVPRKVREVVSGMLDVIDSLNEALENAKSHR